MTNISSECFNFLLVFHLQLHLVSVSIKTLEKKTSVNSENSGISGFFFIDVNDFIYNSQALSLKTKLYSGCENLV